jgi:hypothetical protein
MLAPEAPPSDQTDVAIGKLLGLEGKGIRLRPTAHRILPAGDLEKLEESDRRWIETHEQALLRLLQVRPIRALDEDPDPARTFGLAPPQMGMWIGAGHADPAVRESVATTNQSIRLLCQGAIDFEAVERAFRRITLKHPALRACLECDAPRQSFHSADDMNVARRDLSGMSRSAAQAVVEQTEKSGCAFFGGQLTRATVFRLAEETHLFHLVCNHVVIDGWSAPIVTQDFISAYRAGPGDDTPWREQGRFYFGYLEGEQNLAKSARKDLAAGRWRRWLADAPSRSVSPRPDRLRAGDKEFCDAVHRETLDPALPTLLGRAARALGVTPGAIVTAAIMLLLVEESDCDTPVALMLDSGRSRPEQARLCGFFATPLPISMSIDPCESLEAHASRTAAVLRERRGEPLDWAALTDAYPHRPAANPDRLAAFTFNIVNFDVMGSGASAGGPPAHAVSGAQPDGLRPAASVDAVRFQPLPPAYHGAANPGDLCPIIVIHGRPACLWSYNARLFDPGTLHRLTVRLVELISLICERPAATVGETIRARAPA